MENGKRKVESGKLKVGDFCGIIKMEVQYVGNGFKKRSNNFS